jgi:hypothetical protein
MSLVVVCTLLECIGDRSSRLSATWEGLKKLRKLIEEAFVELAFEKQ